MTKYLTKKKIIMLIISFFVCLVFSTIQAATTVVLWHHHPEWKNRILAVIDMFEKEQSDIKVRLESYANANYNAKINSALAAGEAPDFFLLRSEGMIKNAVDSKYIQPLTEISNFNRLKPSAKSAGMWDGKIYGVPMLGQYTVALYYHRKVFEKYGLTPPKTWEELISVFKTLKKNGETPFILPAQDGIVPYFTYSMIASSILKNDGFQDLKEGKIKFTDEKLAPTFKFFREIYDYAQDGALGTPYATGKALFAHGRGAMMVGGSADYAGYTEINPNVDLGVIPFPSPAGGGTPSTVTGMEGVFVVNANTKYSKEVQTFLNWMLTDKPAQLVADTITLSTVIGIAASENRAMKEMFTASQSNNVRAWHEHLEMSKFVPTFQKRFQEVLIDKLSVEEFAKILQDTM